MWLFPSTSQRPLCLLIVQYFFCKQDLVTLKKLIKRVSYLILHQHKRPWLFGMWAGKVQWLLVHTHVGDQWWRSGAIITVSLFNVHISYVVVVLLLLLLVVVVAAAAAAVVVLNAQTLGGNPFTLSASWYNTANGWAFSGFKIISLEDDLGSLWNYLICTRHALGMDKFSLYKWASKQSSMMYSSVSRPYMFLFCSFSHVLHNRVSNLCPPSPPPPSLEIDGTTHRGPKLINNVETTVKVQLNKLWLYIGDKRTHSIVLCLRPHGNCVEKWLITHNNKIVIHIHQRASHSVQPIWVMCLVYLLLTDTHTSLSSWIPKKQN